MKHGIRVENQTAPPSMRGTVMGWHDQLDGFLWVLWDNGEVFTEWAEDVTPLLGASAEAGGGGG